MEELGRMLKQAREKQGLSLEEISSATKIHRRHLEAIEEEAFHLLPGPAYARAFLRHYARAVGLDPEFVVDRYREKQVLLGLESAGEPLAASVPVVRGRERRRLRHQRRAKKARWALALIVIVLFAAWAIYAAWPSLIPWLERMGIGASPSSSPAGSASEAFTLEGSAAFFATNGGGHDGSPAPSTPIEENEVQAPAAEYETAGAQLRPVTQVLAGQEVFVELIPETHVSPPQGDVEVLGDGDIASAAPGEAEGPPEPEAFEFEVGSMPPVPADPAPDENPALDALITGDELHAPVAPVQAEELTDVMVLDVDVVEACWFDVFADGNRIFTGTLEAGTKVTWVAQELLVVRFGRPEGVYLTLNGTPLGRAGTGVITREFRKEVTD